MSALSSFRAWSCALLFAVLGTGCSGDLARLGEAATPLVVQQVRDQRGMLMQSDASAALGKVEVYTDLTLTMQPFAAAGPGAAYGQLLNHLDQSLGGNLSFYGFGFATRADTAQAVGRSSINEVLWAGSYTRVNNDYGALFARFSDLRATRVVVTDGVQSDPEGGGRFGRVVEGAQAHLARGGVFAAYVYRSPYNGTYYPEAVGCAGPVAYSCAGRPFVVFVFAPSRSALDAFARYASSSGARPVATIASYGAVGVALAEETYTAPAPAAEGNARRRPAGPRAVRVLSNVQQVPVQGYRDITVARVRQGAVDGNGFLPLQFDLEMPEAQARALGAEGVRRAFASLRPSLKAWAVSGRAGKDLKADTTRPVFVKDPEAAPQVEVNGRTGRFVVRVRRPEGMPDKVRHIAWLVTFRLAEADAVQLVPEGLSTSVDCASDQCDKALNLRAMLGAVLNRTYIDGRLLFLTDWPKKG